MADQEEIVRILNELSNEWRRQRREQSIDHWPIGDDWEEEAMERQRQYNRYRPRNARGYRRRNYNRKDYSYNANHTYDDYYQNNRWNRQ